MGPICRVLNVALRWVSGGPTGWAGATTSGWPRAGGEQQRRTLIGWWRSAPPIARQAARGHGPMDLSRRDEEGQVACVIDIDILLNSII